MKNPWIDKQFLALPDRLKVSYLYLRTYPWPLPGIFVLPKNPQVTSIAEIDEMIYMYSMVHRNNDVIYVPGCIPGLPANRVKARSMVTRLRKVPECEARNMWVEELREFYNSSKDCPVRDYIGHEVYGVNPIDSDFEKVLNESEFSFQARCLVRYFKEKAEAATGKIYIPSMGPDLKKMKDLLKELDEDDIKYRIDQFVHDKWYTEKNLISVGSFSRAINRMNPKPKESSDGDMSGYRRFVERFA